MSTCETTLQSPLTSLSIGIADAVRSWLTGLYSVLENKDMPCDLEALISCEGPEPGVVFCSEPSPGISLLELAQVVRAQYRSAPIFFLADSRTKFNRAQLLKNGFTDVFFLPIDGTLLERTVSDLRRRHVPGIVEYDPVHLLDLRPGVVLDFDTYILLPSKGKYLKYSSAGDELDPERIERLKTHQLSSLFVSRADMPKFYTYAATTLRAIKDDPGLSETVRAQRMRGAVREVFSGMFTETVTSTESGRKVVEDCKNIVKAYVKGGGQGSMYDRLLAAVNNNSDTYGHSAGVSTFASLFALALGHKEVESLALAGLLHDIGLALVAPEVQRKPEAEWNDEDRKAYQRHVEHSITLIQDRKLILPKAVHQIIRQHHERFDGTGYPEQLFGQRICPEAQILAIADAFEEKMTSPNGQRRPQPAEVLQSLQGTLADPELVKKLIALFSA